MAKRKQNPQLAKLHRTYTIEEAASLYGIHKNTVSCWIKQGLPVCDDRRPLLITGTDLRSFLQAKRLKNKRPCKPGEIYCVRCRVPQNPAGGLVEYQAITETFGNLVGICPDCESMIYRRISMAKVHENPHFSTISVPLANSHIVERGSPCVNSEFRHGEKHHE